MLFLFDIIHPITGERMRAKIPRRLSESWSSFQYRNMVETGGEPWLEAPNRSVRGVSFTIIEEEEIDGKLTWVSNSSSELPGVSSSARNSTDLAEGTSTYKQQRKELQKLMVGNNASDSRIDSNKLNVKNIVFSDGETTRKYTITSLPEVLPSVFEF